jgi:hypothetical protein
VEDIFEAVQGHTVMKFDDGSSSLMPDVSHHTGYYNFLLRSTAAARQRKDVYPLPSQMLFLWQIYTENVDPFIKILHKPTTAKVIREIRSNYDLLGPSMQALVLAISLAAIMSLEYDEVSCHEKLISYLLTFKERSIQTSTRTKTNFLPGTALAPNRHWSKPTFSKILIWLYFRHSPYISVSFNTLVRQSLLGF